MTPRSRLPCSVLMAIAAAALALLPAQTAALPNFHGCADDVSSSLDYCDESLSIDASVSSLLGSMNLRCPPHARATSLGSSSHHRPTLSLLRTLTTPPPHHHTPVIIPPQLLSEKIYSFQPQEAGIWQPVRHYHGPGRPLGPAAVHMADRDQHQRRLGLHGGGQVCHVLHRADGYGELVQQEFVAGEGEVFGNEMRAFNNINWHRTTNDGNDFIGLTGYGPNINIARDPRFGQLGASG